MKRVFNVFAALHITYMATGKSEPPVSTGSLVRREFKRFGETTSIRGISRAFKSSDKILSVVWSLAVVLCGTMLSYQLVITLISYFSYDYTTVLREDDSLSVCNCMPRSLHVSSLD